MPRRTAAWIGTVRRSSHHGWRIRRLVPHLQCRIEQDQVLLGEAERLVPHCRKIVTAPVRFHQPGIGMPGETLDNMCNFVDHHMPEYSRRVLHRFNPIEEYDDVPA